MLQENVRAEVRTEVGARVRRRSDERRAILRVLERAASDDAFIAQLTDRGSEVLRRYGLTPDARAALLGGDVRWIEARVGRLSPRQRTWIDCRLQQEVW